MSLLDSELINIDTDDSHQVVSPYSELQDLGTSAKYLLQ